MRANTHEAMVAGAWFTTRDLNRVFGPNWREYTDRISCGRAKGGYGMNILEKVHIHPSMPKRVEAAKKLAHLLCHRGQPTPCPVCEQ